MVLPLTLNGQFVLSYGERNALEYRLGEDFARKLDAEDPLSKYSARFYRISDCIYMDGNSLGLMSKDAEETLMRVIDEWKTLGIAGWGKGKIPWIDYGETLGNLQAPLVGAEAGEVIVTNSTTVNLHNLVATFYKPKGKRVKIIADELNFPSDLFRDWFQICFLGQPVQNR